MNISKREKTLLIIVFVLALIGGYYMFYLKPCIEDIRSTNTEIETLEMQKSASEQQNAQAENLQAQVNEMGAQLTLYGDSVTHTFDQPAVLSYLSSKLGQYAVVAGIQFDRATTTDIIEQYEITVAMVTTYDQLKQALDTLEESPYLIRISQLTIASAASDTSAEEDTAAEGTEVTATTTEGTIAPDTAAPSAADLKLLAISMKLDFYCLSEPIPEDEIYSFDTPRQYGGDIFY
jgi:Tfp pilus assembly protein PilO